MDQIEETSRKIRDMEIRGAGRIARAAAAALMELALSLEVADKAQFDMEMGRAADTLLKTRPTAISLSNAISMTMRYKADDLESSRRMVVQNARDFIERSGKAVERIGEIGSKRIRNADVILTHCNSMAALSIIKSAHMEGKDIKVIATESRPRRQGILTIGMLDEMGVSAEMIVDSAVRSIINEVDYVIVGADVITANGSLVNKVGTSQIALCAREARTPFLVAAETYKFSPRTIMGEMVQIEERSPEEVLVDHTRYRNLKVRNPAFDVTPHRYIDLIITEVGAIPPEMSYLIIKETLGWELSGDRT